MILREATSDEHVILAKVGIQGDQGAGLVGFAGGMSEGQRDPRYTIKGTHLVFGGCSSVGRAHRSQ